MKRVYGLAATVLVTVLQACVPGSSVTVNVPRLPAVITLAPEPHVFFSTLEGDAFVRELDRMATVVHPSYRLSTRTLNYGGNNIGRYLTDRLSNGVTRIVIWPANQSDATLVRHVVDAFLENGVATLSGLPDLEPAPVPFLTVTSGGELFRFYAGTDRSRLIERTRTCRTDYVIKRDPADLGTFNFDATDMPDGRTRLYIDFIPDNEDLARLTELQSHVGLVLACLEQRVGPASEV
jgi:hypothetical protein